MGLLTAMSSTGEERQMKVREEVDAVVARHRTGADQTATDVLDTLPLGEGEVAVPMNDIRLRKSVRLVIPGTTSRKNTSGRDIPIGKFDINSDIYPALSKSNAGRYFMKDHEAMKSHIHTQVGNLVMTPVVRTASRASPQL
jgi:hypothetical protein